MRNLRKRRKKVHDIPAGEGLSEEEKLFISECFSEKQLSGKQIIQAFKEKFDWIPSASTVSKYQKYKGKEKTDDAGSGSFDIITDDTRKVKDKIIDISDEEIDEEDFNKMVEMRGTNKAETWKFLRACLDRGYTKINIETGDITE